MAVVNKGATILQASISKLEETVGHCWIWKNFWIRVSEQELLCCGSLVKGQIDVWEMFSDNSYLSAILDRQGLQVAAPIGLRTKMAECFSPQLIQGFWQKLKKKNSKIVVMSPTFETRDFKKEEMVWQQYHLCVDVAEHQILGGKHPYLGTRIRKDLVVEKGAVSPEKKYHCQWTRLRGEKPKWIFSQSRPSFASTGGNTRLA